MLSNYFGNNFSSISTSVTTIAVYKVHYLPADLLAIAAQLNIGAVKYCIAPTQHKE
jgi:hypothetical protein